MTDIDPRSTASRAQRASAGLTALAAALLVCGAAVEVTGNVLDSSANGSGGGSHPSTTVQPTHTRSHVSETPSPDRPAPTSPAYLPGPTATATATGSSFNRR
jgi:hypothetical protein